MKGIHRDQVEYLKKRICRGDSSKTLLQKFKKKWELGAVTFHRRVAIARAELRSNGAPAAWVLVNFSHNDTTQDNQNEAPKFCPHGVPLDNQNSSINHHQKIGEIVSQFSSGRPIEKVVVENDQKAVQSMIKKEVVRDNQKSVEIDYQKRVEAVNQKKAEAEVKAAAEELLCTEIMTMDECLLMLTRFAHGQYKRERHIVCRGEVVEVMETPTFAARRAAVVAIMKYHQVVGKSKDNGLPSNRKYVTLTDEDLRGLSRERISEITKEFQAMR
jgi:hypothetical protein